LSGNGDIIEPDDGIIGIGSGGTIAMSAARGMMNLNPSISAEEIVKSSLQITSEICIYTNNNISVETL